MLQQQLFAIQKQEALLEQHRQAAAKRDPIKEEQRRLLAIQKAAERRKASPLLAMTDDLMGRFKNFNVMRQNMLRVMQTSEMEGQTLQQQAQQLGMTNGQMSPQMLEKYRYFQTNYNKAQHELNVNILPKLKVITAQLTAAKNMQALEHNILQLKTHVMKAQGGQASPQQQQQMNMLLQNRQQCLQLLAPALEQWKRAQTQEEEQRKLRFMQLQEAEQRREAAREQARQNQMATGRIFQVEKYKTRKGHEVEQENIIGQGSFADVYKGTWCDQTVALKVLRQRGEDGDKKEKFMEEVHFMQGYDLETDTMLYGSELSHPNIVNLLDVCDEPTMVIVCEFAKRGSLQHLIRDKRPGAYNLYTGIKVTMDAACGLAYIHGLDPKLMHRDIKAANM